MLTGTWLSRDPVLTCDGQKRDGVCACGLHGAGWRQQHEAAAGGRTCHSRASKFHSQQRNRIRSMITLESAVACPLFLDSKNATLHSTRTVTVPIIACQVTTEVTSLFRPRIRGLGPVASELLAFPRHESRVGSARHPAPGTEGGPPAPVSRKHEASPSPAQRGPQVQLVAATRPCGTREKACGPAAGVRRHAQKQPEAETAHTGKPGMPGGTEAAALPSQDRTVEWHLPKSACKSTARENSGKGKGKHNISGQTESESFLPTDAH